MPCPDIESWKELLAGDLPPEQRECRERHLETCLTCQERVDHSEKLHSGLEELAHQFGDPTLAPADPTLTQFVTRLCEIGWPVHSAAESADLYFLEPSERTDLLGTLGEYEVQEVIGQGGMGVVLKAFDPGLNRLVAIKVLAEALAGSTMARRRFTREARAAAAVCHDHVVAVYGVHEARGVPYLVMQYVAGESLQSRLDREGPLDVVETVRIGMQTASGLAAAHAQGLIHRDIKPANLLIQKDEGGRMKDEKSINGSDSSFILPPSSYQIKITDFGLARMVDDVACTQNGVVAGTPEYMAPEQARGEPIDHRADLFSLGSVLYALCTGRPPFQGTSAVGVLRKVSDETPLPVRSLNPDVPEWLEAMITRLMAKNPALRFQSAAEVAGLLERYLAYLREPVPPVPELPSWPAAGSCPSIETAPVRAFVRGGLRPFYLPALVVLAALVTGIAFHLAAGGDCSKKPDPGTEYHEYHVPLRGRPDNLSGMNLVGPNSDECVRFEPTGLRINLSAGFPTPRQVGLSTGIALKGDFEITVSFEILEESAPERAGSGGDATPLMLWLYRTTGDRCIASIARRLGVTAGPQFSALATRFEPAVGKMVPTGTAIPAEAKTGRLRLVRSGGELSYYVSEGASTEFGSLATFTIGTENLDDLRLIGSTLDSRASLDARFTDLHVRMGSKSPAGVEVAYSVSKGWLAAGVVIGLGLTLSVALCTWVYARRRRLVHDHPSREPAVSVLSFPCAACGTKLKVKADLAGRSAKCPHCGQAIQIPPASSP
jgi:serine/threonine protein kinase